MTVNPSGPHQPSLDSERVQAAYQKYADDLRRFLLGVLRNETAAADALQSTFIKLMEKGHSVRQLDSLKSWLFQVAFNEAMLIRRREGISRKHAERVAWRLKMRADADEVNPQIGQALSQIIRDEDVAMVRSALAELTEAQRVVVKKRIYEELKFREIAEQLDVPLGTVLARMQSGLKKLKSVLDSPQSVGRVTETLWWRSLRHEQRRNDRMTWIGWRFATSQTSWTKNSCAAFELRLADDQAARDAVVQAMEHSQLLLAGLTDDTTSPAAVEVAGRGNGYLVSSRLASQLLAFAASLMLIATGLIWMASSNYLSSYHPPPIDSYANNVATENLASAWAESLDEISKVDFQFSDEEEPGYTGGAGDDTESWMFVAAEELQNSRHHSRAAQGE